jgi:hypothetical protein
MHVKLLANEMKFLNHPVRTEAPSMFAYRLRYFGQGAPESLLRVE